MKKEEKRTLEDVMRLNRDNYTLGLLLTHISDLDFPSKIIPEKEFKIVDRLLKKWKNAILKQVEAHDLSHRAKLKE